MENNIKNKIEVANSERHWSFLKVIGVILILILTLGLAKEILKDIK